MSASKKPKAPKTAKRATRSAKMPTAGRKSRTDSKQSKLIEMLRRPEGATIAKLAKALDWQNHTVRGVMSSALKKKLGLTISSAKAEGGERTYRIDG